MLTKEEFITLFIESSRKEVAFEIQPNEFFEQHFEYLLIHFFLNTGYYSCFFFYSFDYWKNLSYAKWEQLYLKLILARREKQASPFGLKGFIGLVYNAVKVDLLHHYIEDLKKYNQLDYAEGYVTSPYFDFQHYSLDTTSFILKVYNISTFSEYRAVGERWQKEGAIRAIPLKIYIKSYEPPTTTRGCRFNAPQEELLPYYNCPKHWAYWVYPLMAMKYNEKLATKTIEIKNRATQHPLLAREKYELDILQKLQQAQTTDSLQQLQSEVENTPADADLKAILLKRIAKKMEFI